jgi:muramidase (phage lysozyme)
MAEKLIEECGALKEVDTGEFEVAVKKCSKEWASFPGGSSGQHENSLEALKAKYTTFGGVFSNG